MLAAQPDPLQRRQLEAGELEEPADLVGCELDGVFGHAPRELGRHLPVGAVDDEPAPVVQDPVGLCEERHHLFGPEVLDVLTGVHEIDARVGDVPDPSEGGDVRFEPLDVVRQLFGSGHEGLHRDVALDAPVGALDPVEVPRTVGAGAEHGAGPWRHVGQGQRSRLVQCRVQLDEHRRERLVPPAGRSRRVRHPPDDLLDVGAGDAFDDVSGGPFGPTESAPHRLARLSHWRARPTRRTRTA